MRALTEQLYVDETEAAEEGLADMLDENAFHQAPMPGTSMRQPTANPNAGMSGPSPAMRYRHRPDLRRCSGPSSN